MRILYLWPGIVRHCRNFVSGNDKLSLFEALGMGKCACGRISFGTPIACIRNVTRCLSADGARSLVSCKTFGEEDLVHCTPMKDGRTCLGRKSRKQRSHHKFEAGKCVEQLLQLRAQLRQLSLSVQLPKPPCDDTGGSFKLNPKP